MASKIGICNMALSHLGISKEIAIFDTEKSEEAGACRRYYDEALYRTLRDFHWPFATKIDALALVGTDPNTEWSYSYRCPTDCIDVRRILSGDRNDTRQSRVPFRIAQDIAGLLIFTDTTEAEMEYTIKAENPLYYPSDFIMAFSFYLAFLIAPRITGGDQFKLGDRALKLYVGELMMTKKKALNEAQIDEEPASEFIRVRD